MFKYKCLFVIALVSLLFLTPQNAFSQTTSIVWKKLKYLKKDLWYDSLQLKTNFSYNFDITILEQHTPAVDMPGIKGKINKTETLYAIDFNEGKYSIRTVKYFDIFGKIIQTFSYDLDKQIEKSIYSFPILETSFLLLLSEEFKKSEK